MLNLAEAQEAPVQRLFGRFEIEGSTASLSDSDGFEVRRLSLSGMLARSPSHLPRHTRCEISFDVEGGTFHTHARIVHASQVDTDDDQPTFDMGIEFLHTLEESVALLERFIRERFGS